MPRFYTEFPYTNIGDINLDWIINEIKSLEERVTALEEQIENGGVNP